MKRSVRLLLALAFAIGLCTSAARPSAAAALTYVRAATFQTPALLAAATDLTPGVRDELSKKHGITAAAKEGVAATAAAGALIWGVALWCLLAFAPRLTSEPGYDEWISPDAH